MNTASTAPMRARVELMTALDKAQFASWPRWVALDAPPPASIAGTLAPLQQQDVTTPAGRRVLLAVVNAAEKPDYLKAWQYVITRVLDRLNDFALPTEKELLQNLRSEVLAAVQRPGQSDEAFDAAMGAFVRRFHTGFGTLLSNVVTSTNSVLLVALDGLAAVAPDAAEDMVQACAYFLRGNDCVLLAAPGSLHAAGISPTLRLSHEGAAAAQTAGDTSNDATLNRRATMEGSLSELGVNPMVSRLALPLVVTLGTLFVDQLIKVLMRGQLQTPVLGDLLKLGMVNGVPAAFSVLPVLVELAGLGIAGTMLYSLVSRMSDAPPVAHRLQAIGLAVVCGALLSNLLDRMVVGTVFNYAQILQLPLFNLAHAALLAGAGLVLFSVMRKH